jgi:hypothetical protein
VRPVESLQRAAAAGVQVTLNGDRLAIRSSAPPPAEILKALAEHKVAIIDHLGRTCCHCNSPGEFPRSVHSGPPGEILRVAISRGHLPGAPGLYRRLVCRPEVNSGARTINIPAA